MGLFPSFLEPQSLSVVDQERVHPSGEDLVSKENVTTQNIVPESAK